MQRSLTLSALLVAVTIGGAACGGSDDSSESDSADPVVGDVEIESAPADEPAEAPAEATGDGGGIGTMTLDDGTVYSFEMTTCATSVTDPSSFLIEVGFDAFGRSSEGFTLQLIRAAFEESPDLQPTAGFEGSYDENGVNPEIMYIRDGDADLQIDGGRIFGTVQFRDFFSTDPIHGDGFSGAIEVNC